MLNAIKYAKTAGNAESAYGECRNVSSKPPGPEPFSRQAILRRQLLPARAPKPAQEQARPIPGTAGGVYRFKKGQEILHFSAARKTVKRMIIDPDTVTITIQPGSCVTLSRSLQKTPKSLIMSHLTKLNPLASTTGELRVVHIQN